VISAEATLRPRRTRYRTPIVSTNDDSYRRRHHNSVDRLNVIRWPSLAETCVRFPNLHVSPTTLRMTIASPFRGRSRRTWLDPREQPSRESRHSTYGGEIYKTFAPSRGRCAEARLVVGQAVLSEGLDMLERLAELGDTLLGRCERPRAFAQSESGCNLDLVEAFGRVGDRR
jgi:hypothetical protein